MTQAEEQRLLSAIEALKNQGYSFNGVSLVSGANTIKGDFYGLSIGSTKPDSLKIVPKDNITLNGSQLLASNELVDFLSEGEFIPIEFTEITLTGSGFVKCYNK